MKTAFLHIEEGEIVNLISLKGVSFDPEQISKIKARISSLIASGRCPHRPADESPSHYTYIIGILIPPAWQLASARNGPF